MISKSIANEMIFIKEIDILIFIGYYRISAIYRGIEQW